MFSISLPKKTVCPRCDFSSVGIFDHIFSHRWLRNIWITHAQRCSQRKWNRAKTAKKHQKLHENYFQDFLIMASHELRCPGEENCWRTSQPELLSTRRQQSSLVGTFQRASIYDHNDHHRHRRELRKQVVKEVTRPFDFQTKGLEMAKNRYKLQSKMRSHP